MKDAIKGLLGTLVLALLFAIALAIGLCPK